MAFRTVSRAELATHNVPGDLWMVIDGDVYDVSKFARVHPGGARVLEAVAGTDTTETFFELHRRDVLKKYSRLVIGRLEGAPEVHVSKFAISPVPFDDMPWLQGMNSPYYTESHRKFQKAVREFVQDELAPIAMEEDVAGSYVEPETKKKCAMAGMMVTRMGPGPWLQIAMQLGISLPGDVKPSEFDYFHEMIVHMEMTRLGVPGWGDGLSGGLLISMPAILHFGSEETRNTIGKELLLGDKQSWLAITEPYAGSDVASLCATAVKTSDGKHYIVNGIKKWITEGNCADYFVTAVRTGGKGARGLSLLVVPRVEGVVTKQMSTTYSKSAATALVIMTDVKVPVENLLGKENDGFRLIMYNFNHERWMISVGVLGYARAALADCFKWARQRKVFGQPLIKQPVILDKLANSAAALSGVWALLEQVTYDMNKSKGGPMSDRMGGQIALLKLHTTKVADDCVQIMGGRGITKTGMGARVENFKNFAKYGAVYGGSEEIMASLAVRMLLKGIPNDSTAKL
eukprot:TRINITY_DN9687_c0_g1_i1.p1 TRINITY_DN9687_c0_g1~~TRINITY_DN9687_c0_g1_i1.p1  ORF type:complete len:516 (+),score=102.68 TRINITY_DN9687_c0_g1_i1:64-1611(+)